MLMSKPIGGARKSIKNQEGQGMLDIDENGTRTEVFNADSTGSLDR